MPTSKSILYFGKGPSQFPNFTALEGLVSYKPVSYKKRVWNFIFIYLLHISYLTVWEFHFTLKMFYWHPSDLIVADHVGPHVFHASKTIGVRTHQAFQLRNVVTVVKKMNNCKIWLGWRLWNPWNSSVLGDLVRHLLI